MGVLVLVVGGWIAWSYVLRPAVVATPAPTPTVAAHPTSTPEAPSGGAAIDDLANRFLSSWAAGHYTQMYDDLSPQAQRNITRKAFVARYQGITSEATIKRVQPLVVASAMHDTTAAVTYTVDMSTTAVGAIHQVNTLPLRFADGRWGIAWTPDVIFPGLGASYRVHLFDETAHRGSIVDRLGQPLAVEGRMIQIGVVPEYIHDEKALLAFLSGFLHLPAPDIQAKYNVSWAKQNPSDFVPIATVSSVQWNAVPLTQRQALEGNGLDPQSGVWRRIYPQGTLAAPLLGYVRSTDEAGSAGLEHWADTYLSGQNGSKLAIANAPDYSYIASTIKERPAQDGDTVHLTLDPTLQAAAEKALAGKVGAVVALRPSDGAVLAMASVPGYDPNSFVAGLTPEQYNALTASPHRPLYNHASEGAYPLGSVFKIVAMGAALEKGGYTVNSQIPGPGVWYGLGPNFPMHDWLASGHGIISLHEALVQSCDTCFYQIGLQLDQKSHYLLPDYARAWGLGKPTGIVGVPESAGIIPDPHWTLTQRGEPWVPGDAVNMTIGQGYVEVTPLQAAQMLAALGDNGTMHQPYLVSRITAANGSVVRDFPPVVKGTLPLSQPHLEDILRAMLGVTTEPTGTAVDKFAGFRWPVGGKTGTAQAGALGPHAWFAALAPLGHPRIALIVMVEHGGEGSQVAAPIARQLLQTFFTKVPDLAGTAPSKGPSTLTVP